jgi:hypothetical protein
LRCVLPHPLALASRSTVDGTCHTDLPTSLDGARLAAALPPRSPASVKRSTDGTGLSTCCPSGSACAYPLGPTNPPRIILAAEPSGFRWWGFAPHFSVTHSGIRTRRRSSRACARPSPHRRRSPTMPDHNRSGILCFGRRLGPAGLSAHRHSTSELLRTLSRVAASKPTSWLSSQRHILSHSAVIWGP